MPELHPGAYFYYQAFHDLWQYREPQHSRDHLTWEALNSYATRYKLTNKEFEDFVEVIREMEKTFLEHRFRDKGDHNGEKT